MRGFQADVTDYDARLTSPGILQTTETPQLMAHAWGGGWVPIALAALHQDSINVAPQLVAGGNPLGAAR